MRNKIIFLSSSLGVLGALGSAYVYAVPSKPLPPVFNPAPTLRAGNLRQRDRRELPGQRREHQPLPRGRRVDRRSSSPRGSAVTKGTALVQIDDTVQRAPVEQQRSQAEAAQALLEELRAQPRKENLEVARAQVEMAQASLKTAHDTLDKQQSSYKLDPESVSKDVLDNAINAAEGRRGQPRGRHASVRAHQGGRLGLRRPEPGEAGRGHGEGVRGVERACSQSTRFRPRATASCSRSTRRWAATFRPRAPTTRTPRASVRSWSWAHPRRRWRCAATSTRSSSRACRPPRSSRRRCSSAGRTRRSHSSSFVCSRTSRPRSSCPTSAGEGRPSRAARHLPLPAAGRGAGIPGRDRGRLHRRQVT